MTEAATPDPLGAGDLDAALARLAAGDAYRPVLEELLVTLAPERASRLDLLLRESRGAWIPQLESGPGRALFLGNGFSGTVLALARADFDVVCADASSDRLAWASGRHAALAETRFDGVHHAGDGPLPFDDGSFDVVVQEGRLDAQALAERTDELFRVARGDVVLIGDNRLAYKLSSGHRAEYRVPGPMEFASRALKGSDGRRTLPGYRRLLDEAGFASTRAFSLYPHADDYSLVVALDAERPGLFLGPKERKNRVKVAANKLGLFPVFTSSFALVSRKQRERGTTRIERILEHIANELDEPVPEPEIWIASRGNSAVLHTALPRGVAADGDAGRWTLHLPFSLPQERRVARNVERLRWLSRERPDFPHAEGLFLERIEGVLVGCQRRLPGISAAQVSGQDAPWAHLLPEVARRLAELVVEPRVTIDDSVFEELVGAKFDLCHAHATPSSTRRTLERMRDEARERLVGTTIPRVLYHADLRSKHVQVQPDGSLVALLDWGSSEASDLPYADLISLIVYERQHRFGVHGGDAWRQLMERRGLTDAEERALASCAEGLELPEEYCRAVEAIFPVLVGGMAEKNWDYSRPRWLQRLYGL